MNDTMIELTTPYADLLPPLSTEEFAALSADIAINGVHTPIVIDEVGAILDGHHRYKIAPDAPRRVIEGLSPDEKIAYVLGSNMKRRNLSPDQKRELREKMQAAAIALNKIGKTQEDTAALLGIDRTTVSRWLTTNVNNHNGCQVDARLVIPKEADPVILARLDAGETHEQVAADYKVTKQAITKRAVKARKKAEKQRAATIPQAPEVIQEPAFAVSLGDVWQLGQHRVMCGDAYSLEDTALLAGDDTITALITDPPYGIGYKPDWNKWDGAPTDFTQVTGDDQEFDPAPFLHYPTVALFGANYFSDKLPIGGWACWDKRLDPEKDAMFGSPFELAWYRSVNTERKAIMIRVLHGGVVNADSEKGNNEKRWVSTQKPNAVMEQLLDALVKPDDVIYDPFIGSGTTLLACERKGLKCLAMDIEPECVGITLERWSKKTNNRPILLTGKDRDGRHS